ncbi:hypothetical protein AZE42_12905 [Rhizopogon vesiculosus]|uniref:Uncharacterized protein n=1 Tax=Rhizopogon vesiculosus TaxID=180088 RepID=A0A1J8QYP3_9AGAM|nr:hypothetical protein AZE42_12905 [Rhizopogon vesiculosus]
MSRLEPLSRRPRTAPTPQRHPDTVPEISLKRAELAPDTSTVPQQELRPSSSVPSLTQVIEEGNALAEQRKQLQKQTSRSLGNSRTRSLSRARTKSLPRNLGRPRHKPEGSTALEILAARTLLGGQSIDPTVSVTYTSHSRSYSDSHTMSDTRTHSNLYSFSHSHSHSVGNTSSQKSITDPHSTRHIRSDSWSKTALLKACDEEDIVIIKGASPVPSAQSGECIGITLLSFPPFANRSRPTHGLEDTDMPDHPYATAGTYTGIMIHPLARMVYSMLTKCLIMLNHIHQPMVLNSP